MPEKKYACPYLYDKGVTSPISLSTLYNIHGITDHPTDIHITWYSLSSAEWLNPVSYSSDSLYDSFTGKYFIRDKFSTQEMSSSWLTIDELVSGAWYTFNNVMTQDAPVSPSNTPVAMYSITTSDLVDAIQYNEDDHTTKYLIKDTYNTADFRWLCEDELEGTGYSLTEPVMPLNFTALNGGGTVALTRVGASTSFTCSYKYSTDNVNWDDYTIDAALTLNEGDKIYFKGSRSAQSISDYLQFVMTGTISASGSVNSLLSENFEQITDLIEFGEFTFYNLFYGCESLTRAPELPATELANYCYNSMFNECTSLEVAPELSADVLTENCYNGMFSGCTSLTSSPELPATILAEYCYQEMFQRCTSLTSSPELPATNLAENCYLGMFAGCTSLEQAPELPATTLAEYCYQNMFSGCTSLTSASELPATNLSPYCYMFMFNGCRALTSAPDLPATTLVKCCYGYMFARCTSLTSAPELPATILASECYNNMFNGCTRLNEVNCYATDISASYATINWLVGVSPTGTFYKAGVTWPSGTSGIPSGWDVIDV